MVVEFGAEKCGMDRYVATLRYICSISIKNGPRGTSDLA